VKTEVSGLDANSISGEAADLNNDGLLDLYLVCDPSNTWGGRPFPPHPTRFEDKVFWNTGAHGGRENHWLRLRFAGVSDAELIGARVTVHEPGAEKLVGMRVIATNQSYKSGAPIEAHFGLGKRERVDVRVVLPGGRRGTFAALAVDRFLTLDLKTGSAVPVETEPPADR
jgi:hypothetical protein